jgi:hypothetical protein
LGSPAIGATDLMLVAGQSAFVAETFDIRASAGPAAPANTRNKYFSPRHPITQHATNPHTARVQRYALQQ